MNMYAGIIFIVILMALIFTVLLSAKNTDISKEYPYMDKDFLFINSNQKIPLENIIGTEIINDPVAHVIIHYEFPNHAGGMYSIELSLYKKLIRDMLHG